MEFSGTVSEGLQNTLEIAKELINNSLWHQLPCHLILCDVCRLFFIQAYQNIENERSELTSFTYRQIITIVGDCTFSSLNVGLPESSNCNLEYLLFDSILALWVSIVWWLFCTCSFLCHIGVCVQNQQNV